MKVLLLGAASLLGGVGVAYANAPDSFTAALASCCEIVAACCFGGACC